MSKPLYAGVVFPIPLDKVFSYAVPEELRSKIAVGMRTIAPFGKSNRETEGVIVELTEEKRTEHDVKEILDLLDETPFYSDEMLKLTRWVADYYMSSWGEALKCACPAGINVISKRVVSVNKIDDRDAVLSKLSKVAPRQAQVLTALIWEGKMSIKKLKTLVDTKGIYSILTALENKGLITISTEISTPAIKPKITQVVYLSKPIDDIEEEIDREKFTPKQLEILNFLISNDGGPVSLNQINRRVRDGTSVVKTLESKGLVHTKNIEVYRDPLEGEFFGVSEHLKLNPDQELALREIEKAIESERNDIFLLHGVTASGKTEVYIQAIAKLLEKGKGAIVLVPEIALTAQTVFRFASRFGDQVTVLHSKMSPGERYDQWRRVKSGHVRIVVGARSAVFAPMPNLGLIVIDEEHETSYKQQDDPPRYHAREVAIKRAELTNSVVIMGTATPSLESFFKAMRKEYRLISLPERVDNIRLPSVEVVDMRTEFRHKKGHSLFSESLRSAIEDRLAKGEQIILFLNRRGFSTFILCRECGYVARCKNCDISLNYHHKSSTLVCHHCNFRQPVPQICPICKGSYIHHFGTGTQKVEEEARKAFPEATIERLDLDSTTRKGAYKRILDAFRDGDIDILIGTQMIAKGLDFPNVTLVGVILADTAINLPDFRSAERTFNLLTQVAGRAGRGKIEGEVIIQTYNPEHYSILSAQDHDYRSFYRVEIANREMFLYPPFSHLALLLLRSKSEENAMKTAELTAEILESLRESRFPEVEIIGPAPAPLSRIKQYYRWQILLKAVEPKHIRDLFNQFTTKLPSAITSGEVLLSIDMDPIYML